MQLIPNDFMLCFYSCIIHILSVFTFIGGLYEYDILKVKGLCCVLKRTGTEHKPKHGE